MVVNMVDMVRCYKKQVVSLNCGFNIMVGQEWDQETWYKKHHIPRWFIWKYYFFRTFGKKIWCFVQCRFYELNIVIISDPTFAMICLIPLQRRPDYDNVVKLLLVLFFYPVWKRWIFHQPEGPVNTAVDPWYSPLFLFDSTLVCHL